ncbi:hypothetical protein Taro_029843 [Colocasia esculenta]|uniref:Formin-like protein n=1 Tax=Colocasia esculenta TaxID=4460 RepID=A0A843VEU8_COLES|nr:hypothetical protein [Colocasia esculenta]
MNREGGGGFLLCGQRLTQNHLDWSSCRLNLLGAEFTQTPLDEDSFSYLTEVNPEAGLSSEDDIERDIALLPPQMKSAFLDCLSKQHFPFLVSGEEEKPRDWNVEQLASLFGWFGSPRRQLVHHPSHASTATLAPITVAASAPGPGSALAPAPSTMVIDSPTYSPVASPAFTPANSPSPSDDAPPDDPPEETLSIPPESGSPRSPPEAALHRPQKDNETSNRTMIVAVVLTATGSVLFTSLLLYLYQRFFGHRTYAGYGHRDGGPLLTLSSSSSPRTFGMKNSANMDNTLARSGQGQQNHDGQVSSFPGHTEQAAYLDIKTANGPSSAEPAGAAVIDIASPTPAPPPLPPFMHPTKKAPLPPTPPLPPPTKSGPGAPPLPKVSAGPRPPRSNSRSRRTPGSHSAGSSSRQGFGDHEPKTKLKPLFWDKVLASPDQTMVWHQISSGSFQFDEEMIESLFGYSPDQQKNVNKRKSGANSPSQFIQILDPKKSQNLAILLRALNVTTEEIRDAVMEGNDLPSELLQTLIKMAPTADEELKLRLYSGEISHLGPAERFLKSLVGIPFAFKRLEALLFMGSVDEDISSIKKDLATIEASSVILISLTMTFIKSLEACKELKGSRLFKKLLEAVVKIGNRMNVGTYRGDAHAIKLDTLLKLADVKGTGGKTTLLHFVVQEIIRSEGMRAEREAKGSRSIPSLTTVSSQSSDDYADGSPREAGDRYRSLGLQVVSGLPSELESVRNAAALDADAITSTVENISEGLLKIKEFLSKEMTSVEEDGGFHDALEGFVESTELEITWLLEEEKRIRFLVKSTTDFFHGSAVKDEGLRLFAIVRDFLGMLDKACKQVKQVPRGAPRTPVHRQASDPSSQWMVGHGRQDPLVTHTAKMTRKCTCMRQYA